MPSTLQLCDDRLSIDVTIEQSKPDVQFGNLVYRVYAQLILNDSKVDIQTVPSDLLSTLLKKYFTNVRSALVSQSIEKKAAIFKELGFVNRKKGKARLDTSLGDLRTINVFTIDKFANVTIGRTLIELDADIVTLLPKEVIGKNISNIFELHSYSVFLATQYLKYQMEKISYNLTNLSNAIKIASFIPFGITVYGTISRVMTGFHTSDPGIIIFNFLPLIISTVITPILYKYVPKIVIRAAISHFFKTASG